MDEDFQELEASLKGMRPVRPDAACMDRLLAAVERRTPAADLSIERELGKLSPVALDGGLQARLLETVSHVPFPVDEKVVLFPGNTTHSKAAPKAPARRPWIAAAAAVAVLGAFSAVMMGPQQGSAPVADGGKKTEAPLRSVKDLVPASVGSTVSETQDQGIVWTRDGKPLRQVKVIYMDKVKYAGEDGKIVEMERPRVEWLLVPEKID
ncbi:hypothetical protein OKA04_14105 [Luteolibacter flavescens]|uniref:Uncharacterized protein n=1 Tax=Luteolibacter flavescens TaxID=1859460 RepID=A0ABT3FRE9_9BACT|nr:hypothetical protein [Luteolibacter flavescens]MCW1885869.1 hypothetical protein [Luteolibacter flavescens]